MKGHIQLGAPDDLRPYLLIEPRNYRAQTANPMAARVSTGSQYGDLQAWSTFLMADWQAGVGKQQAEAGGFLFGEIESRVPNQLILPGALGCTLRSYSSGEYTMYMPASATTYTLATIGGTGSPTRISMAFTAVGNDESSVRPDLRGVWVLADIPTGVEVTVALYSNNSGAPNAALGTGTMTATASTNYRPGLKWYWLPLSEAYTSGNIALTTYHWVIYPSDTSDTITVACGDTYAGGSAYTYSGSAWSVYTGVYPFFMWSRPFTNGLGYLDGRDFYVDTTDNTIVSWAFNTVGVTASTLLTCVYDNDADWTSTLRLTNTFSSAPVDDVNRGALFDGVVYIPRGANYTAWNLATDAITTSTEDAHLFCSWVGYLWRAYNNQLWYTVDGSTWTAISNDVGPSDYRIRGMAGFGQYLYVATDEALYYVAPGDVAVGVYPWGTTDERNGRGMVVHQDGLYIPVAGRILRYAEDGSMQDIWVNRDDDFNNQRLGEIATLAGLSNWLVAGVNGTTSSDPASVWAYTQQGWHHMATLPENFKIRSLYYDRINSRLWIATNQWAIFYIYAPDWALNPYNDSSANYMPNGWLETGRIYSGLRELRKDWESVRGFGEFITGTTDVEMYYQDTETETWTSLGTLTEDGQELRWSDYDTRPNGRWLRLAVLLRTDDPTETPKIEALATKLLPMITDRRAWNLALLVSDNQEMIDGDVNTYTADEMLAHLRSLVEQVPPFIFEDVNGDQYEVKATGSAENILQYEWLDASQETRILYAFEVAVEQVTTGTYGA